MLRFLQSFCFGNYILSVAVLSWLSAQVLKTIINYLLSGKFDAERLWGAGRMPSAHSAFVCSTFLAAANSEGPHSPAFALSFILAAIVMYDAMGVRRETGEQAKLLNKMFFDTEENGFNGDFKKLKEKVGHTPIEVLSGALLGILIAMLIPAP